MRKSLKFKSVYAVVVLSLLLSLLPVAGGGVALAAAGDLVPLGDQLGDVGQYYSNVSPYLKSRTYIYNTSASSRTVKVAIYNDMGVLVLNDGNGTNSSLTCTVAANRVLYLLMNDLTATGTLTVENQGGSGCTSKTGFHGVYHMKIWQTEGGADLAVAVNTWTVAEQGQPKAVSGSYQAVPEYALQSEFALPILLATRDMANLWDTEIVVQNVNNETIRVAIEWGADNVSGSNGQNNYADLSPYERRIFLASQLLYEEGASGALVERSYWAWGKIKGYLSSNGSPRNIAVITNVFKPAVENGKQKSEKGSDVLTQFEMSRASTGLVIPGFTTTGTAYESKIRVSNPGAYSSNFTIKLYNSSGTQVGSTYSNSVANGATRHVDGTALGVSNATYTVRIASDYPLVAAYMTKTGAGHYGGTAQAVGDTSGRLAYMPFYWSDYDSWDDRTVATNIGSSSQYYSNIFQRTTGSYKTGNSSPVATNAKREVNYGSFTNLELYGVDYAGTSGAYAMSTVKFENYSTTEDRVMAYNAIAVLDNVWYVPFAPAPVVQFEWDAGGNTSEPDGVFGAAPYAATSGHHNWYKEMNYVNWSDNKCSELVSGLTKSRFVPTWWGIGDTGLVSTTIGSGWEWKHDGSAGAYNSETRLKAIRNNMPSECAGRPVKLINEPNNSHEDPDGDGELLGQQANMTYPEQFRTLWLFRSWPGDVYGPFYANPDPNWASSSGCASVSYGEGQARKACFDKFVNNYIPNWSGVSGKTYSFGDFVDGIGLHFYIQPSEINANDPDDTLDDDGAARRWANSWYSHMTTLSNTVPFNAEKTFFIAEYGIASYDGSSAAKQSIVDRLWSYDEIINRGMKAGTPRMWYTNYCSQNAPNCPTFHWVDTLYTGNSTTLTSPVGQGYFNEYKDKND